MQSLAGRTLPFNQRGRAVRAIPTAALRWMARLACGGSRTSSQTQLRKRQEAARTALDAEVAALKSIIIARKRDVENALADYRKLRAEPKNITVKSWDLFLRRRRRDVFTPGSNPGFRKFSRNKRKATTVSRERSMSKSAASLEARATQYRKGGHERRRSADRRT